MLTIGLPLLMPKREFMPSWGFPCHDRKLSRIHAFEQLKR